MGASSTGLKSNRGDTDEDQRNQAQVIVPQLNIQDVENNNNHIIVNPQENNLHFLPLHALIDECDLLNNNTTFINNNYLTVSLTSASSTTLTTSCNKLNQKQALYKLSEQQIQSANRKDKMPKESPKKSPKKKPDEKLTKEKEKKKKKEKPKAPRPAAAAGGGGGRGRGMAEQDQMMRRPRKTKKEK